MQAEFDGLEAAGTFAEIFLIPDGSNVVDSQRLLKRKGDELEMIERAKAIDYFDTFTPTASTTSNRLVAAMACKLDWDLRHLDADQAFIQSELDTENFLRLLPGCGRLSGKVVQLNKALYGLKQSGRS